MEYYNYKALNITSTRKPYSTHFFFEINTTGRFIIVDSLDQTKVYKTDDYGVNWTQIDVDPNNSSGDQKSRDHKIQSAWHDKANNIIYFVDCDNDGTADDFDVWKLDYSTWASISTTEIGTSSGANINTVYVGDIFRIGTNTYVMNFEKRDAAFPYIVVWDVDSAPFVEQTALQCGEAVYVNSWKGIIYGNKYYCIGLLTGNVGVGIEYDHDITTISEGTAQVNGSIPSVSQNGLAYDDVNIIYLCVAIGGVNKLVHYNISEDYFYTHSEWNVALMLDRNTASGVKEKGFHLSNYKVYQLHTNIAFQPFVISTIPTDAILIAITDNFLMNNDGDMFAYVNVGEYIIQGEIIHPIQSHTSAEIGILKDQINIQKGMFIQIKDTYTSQGSISIKTIFEGIVNDYDKMKLQKIWLVSPALQELERTVKGQYSGRSDEIAEALLANYCNYITKGTFGTGTAMGTITYQGDITLKTALDNLAKFEKWIWYLTPDGKLNFRSPPDSLVDLTETSTIFNVEDGNVRFPINYVLVQGAIMAGAVLYKIKEDIFSQQEYGINPIEETYSELDTQALVDAMVLARYDILKLSPIIVWFFYRDPDKGFVQPGESITFQYNSPEPNIASDQFIINRLKYKIKEMIGDYTIVDELI